MCVCVTACATRSIVREVPASVPDTNHFRAHNMDDPSLLPVEGSSPSTAVAEPL